MHKKSRNIQYFYGPTDPVSQDTFVPPVTQPVVYVLNAHGVAAVREKISVLVEKLLQKTAITSKDAGKKT